MKKIRARMSYANLASTVALVLAVGGFGGAAYAVAKNSVGSPQIKNESIRSLDIRNGNVTTKDLRTGTITAGDIRPSTRAVLGPGDGFFRQDDQHAINSGNDASEQIFALNVPPRMYAVQASFSLTNTGGDVNDFTCELVNPIGIFTNRIAETRARVAVGEHHSMALVGVVDMEAVETAQIRLACRGAVGDWSAEIGEPRLVAVEVASLAQDD